MTWIEALREWNKGQTRWCIPRRDTEEYKQVRGLMEGKPVQVPAPTVKIGKVEIPISKIKVGHFELPKKGNQTTPSNTPVKPVKTPKKPKNESIMKPSDYRTFYVGLDIEGPPTYKVNNVPSWISPLKNWKHKEDRLTFDGSKNRDDQYFEGYTDFDGKVLKGPIGMKKDHQSDDAGFYIEDDMENIQMEHIWDDKDGQNYITTVWGHLEKTSTPSILKTVWTSASTEHDKNAY